MNIADMSIEVDEYIEPGMRYLEEAPQTVHSLPVRYCYLWPDGVEAPVSELELLSFRQRFGAVSVAAEGIGGVETLPQFRRQGYMSRLLKKAVEGAARRVDIVFVSEAVEGVYEKFGYVNCLVEGRLLLAVHDVEQSLGSLSDPAAIQGVREYTPNDLPEIINLYNEAHSHRPWTHERHAGWNRLVEEQTWQPGSQALSFEVEGQLRGYAIFQGRPFGRSPNSPFVVDELTARDATAARQLLAALAFRCWQLRLNEFLVREPFDSLVGREARRMGCQYLQSYPASGDMMGAVMNRGGLLHQLEPELQRRSNHRELAEAHAVAFNALQRGELVPDNQTLLRLLLGYWSVADAEAYGTLIPASYEQICAAWFPGGGTALLPAPYAHKLDRY